MVGYPSNVLSLSLTQATTRVPCVTHESLEVDAKEGTNLFPFLLTELSESPGSQTLSSTRSPIW